MDALRAGMKAPDFSLHTTPDQKVSLSDFRGQARHPDVYPADWSPVCGDQMTLYQAVLPEFQHVIHQYLGSTRQERQ